MHTAHSLKQFRFSDIDRVALTAGAAGLLSALAAGFIVLKPNRIAAGKVYSLASTASTPAFVVLLALWIAIILVSISGVNLETRAAMTATFAGFLLVITFYLSGSYAAAASIEHGLISRVSPGGGAWSMLFAEVVLLLNAIQHSGRRKRTVAIICGAAAAGCLFLFVSGRLDDMSIMKEYLNRKDRFFDELKVHITLALASVGAATVMGVPLGIAALKKRGLNAPTFSTLNILQTIPSLALFGILIAPLAYLSARYSLLRDLGVQGIGWAPAFIALTLYSILPVARNTYAGFATVDPSLLDAGRGMGMTKTQLMLRVEIPIASPVVLNGIRVAAVQAIGLTAVAALIGAGGFGVFIFQGLGQAAVDLILLGAVPTILLAVAADTLANWVIAMVRPEGIR